MTADTIDIRREETPEEVREAAEWCRIYQEGLQADPGSDAAKQGRAAAAQLYDRYRGAVEALVKRSAGRGADRAVLTELLAEGAAVFLAQAASYDPTRGLSFAAWMRPKVFRAARAARDRDRLVRAPSAQVRMERIVHRALSDLPQRLGRTPTVEEVADDVRDYTEALVDASPAERERLVKNGTVAALERVESTVEEAVAGTLRPLSLDAPAGDGRELLDTLPADEECDGSLAARLQSILTPDEAFIVEARAGGRKWKELAAELGREWTEVRQVHASATVRMCFPHAQFVALCPLVVTEEPASSPGAMWRQVHAAAS